ncbi:conserved hypothetical protein [delta proteobacterium NaphS2]|nr:conserved hypothetical protein [delta proteobacterium NaphS2]
MESLPCKGCKKYERRTPSMLDDFEGIVDLLEVVFQGMEVDNGKD